MNSKINECSNCVGKSSRLIKYGKTSYSKQRYHCKSCRTTSVLEYAYKAYDKEINQKNILFTKEDLGIESTVRIVKISTTTLLKRIIIIAKNISLPKISYHQSYELDEMRFFIRKKSKPN